MFRLVSVVVVTMVLTSTRALTFRGYLADLRSVDSIAVEDGANMITNPQDLTVATAVSDAAAESGYTLLSKPAPQQASYGPMYNFTASSNALVVTYLKSLDSFFGGDRKQLEVVITGALTPGGQLELAADLINDRGLVVGRGQSLEGYLVDRRSVDSITGGLNGEVDMKERPYDLTMETLSAEAHRDSGYSIMLRKTASNLGFAATYNLTATSNQAAVEWLNGLPSTKTSDFLVQVFGAMDNSGRFNLLPRDGESQVKITAVDSSTAAPSGAATPFYTVVAASMMVVALVVFM